MVDHRDSYTWNLVHLIASVTGSLPDVVEHDEVSAQELAAYTHLVLSPGPGHPDEYDWSVLDLGRPVLGVCLGMQGIVTHFGGAVARVRPAHGEVASVTHSQVCEFDGIPSPFEAVRYHSLAAVRIPEIIEVTATSGDGVVQGVRHRERPISGVQFHPESILSTHGARLIENFLNAQAPR
ncbi:aminodeoxychorismate/anthranilate synthase component II [Nocardioides baekrokdamisoli]|uniref:Aminodeoxychorismate/anthranilate synthase component II n=1 Tax=Nocardioides baekrokdamisoli TaxID=1804624 RepID=A0A3G9INN0_9ACTN|nr:aminodeoxychorismate/anthranilate synthase component II [Nocardioides baekrokdamisoli]BBH17645.1 aminodeoxychorismate/anthranilate synthase component II [Nocardioides baekrokdamisoli]